jgi:hypothetical protein
LSRSPIARASVLAGAILYKQPRERDSV